MVKLELLSINGINTHWDVWYLNDVNGEAILFADNLELTNVGDWVELDIPSDWIAIFPTPIDNTDVESNWFSGSI